MQGCKITRLKRTKTDKGAPEAIDQDSGKADSGRSESTAEAGSIKPVSRRMRAERKASPLFELACVLVRLNHVASFIVNANHKILLFYFVESSLSVF
jgi:hypothetical protein